MTSAFPAVASLADDTARAPSATQTVLRRLRAALIALAMLAGATAALLTIEQHAVSSSAGEHSATAVMQAYAARQALADADSQAVQTIPLGAGPSERYQDDIAAAEQSLEQVAENNTAGSSGTQSLQLIEGLLTAYTGLIEQADAHYRMQVSGTTGVGSLWSASELMHNQILTDGAPPVTGQAYLQSAERSCLTAPAANGPNSQSGLLPDEKESLADLQCYEQRALTAQRSSPWVSPWLYGAWLVAAVAVGAAIATAQRQFAVRLHRVLSKYLTLAAAALIGLCLVTGHVIASEHAFDATQSGPLATVLALQDAQTASSDRQGQSALAKRVIGPACAQCTTEQDAANAYAASDVTAIRFPSGEQAHDIPGVITAQQHTYYAEVAAAGTGFLRSLLLVVALTVLLVLLTFLGFRRHLDEYRYQSL